MVKIILSSDKATALEYISGEAYARLTREACGYFECHGEYIVISFELYDARKSSQDEKIVVYHAENATVFMCESAYGLNKLKTLLNGEKSTLCSVFSALMRNEPHRLGALECKINAIEERLIKYSDSECMQEILDLKYELFDLKAYYAQLVSIFEDCAQNEGGMLSCECAKGFSNLQSRAEKLLNYTLELRDYLSQARDAYQAQIEIDQNRLMRIFTAITAVFLPLNLLVGWYGMNFAEMPELKTQNGYKIFTATCAFIALSLVVFFKKRKWF